MQKLHGYLNYAAGVSPFGRPFLAALTTAIIGEDKSNPIRVTKQMRLALGIWDNILNANDGVSFVLGKLPECCNDIYVDASTEWGIGGYCGLDYFLFP